MADDYIKYKQNVLTGETFLRRVRGSLRRETEASMDHVFSSYETQITVQSILRRLESIRRETESLRRTLESLRRETEASMDHVFSSYETQITVQSILRRLESLRRETEASMDHVFSSYETQITFQSILCTIESLRRETEITFQSILRTIESLRRETEMSYTFITNENEGHSTHALLSSMKQDFRKDRNEHGQRGYKSESDLQEIKRYSRAKSYESSQHVSAYGGSHLSSSERLLKDTDDGKERDKSDDSNSSGMSDVMHQKQKNRKRNQISSTHSSDLGGNTYGYADDRPDNSNASKKGEWQWQVRQKRNKRKPQWTIDTAAWKTCISSNESIIDDLLNEKKLPDKDLLNEAYKVFGIGFIRRVCDAICKFIVQKSTHVIHVYPAFDEATKEIDKCSITFVVLVQKDTDLGKEFQFHIKNINDPNPQENVVIKILEKEKKENEKRKHDTGNETDARLSKCIQKYSKSLSKNHTNVCRISQSGFRSIRFGKMNSMMPTDCITLYVYVKGLIPLGEKLLPTTLDIDGCQVDLDVREGFVEAYTGNHGPYDAIDHLRIGCSIGVEPSKSGESVNGTLGGFFEMGGADFCMSPAHIFLSANELNRLKRQETPLLERIDCAKHVYQPHDNYLRPFGRCRTAVYKEGGDGETGVEVVSILIENRNPNTGEFPMSDTVQGADKEYTRGKIYNREEILNVVNSDANPCFYKYGCETGWTTGKLRFEGATFSTPHSVQDGTTGFQICLHRQFEIVSNDNDNDFAGKSDSGALVLMEDGGELVAVGMVVAGMPGEVCFVTPLDEIFKVFKLDPRKGLKTFPTGEKRNVSDESDEVSVNAEMSNLKTEMNDMKSEMKRVIKDVQDGVNSLADRVEDISRLLQNMGSQQNS